jgi:hypothetical protein
MNNVKSNKKKLSPEQRAELLGVLKCRFENNMNRHQGLRDQRQVRQAGYIRQHLPVPLNN